MPIRQAFSTPLYYVKPKTEDEYNIIREELMSVHEKTVYERPDEFPEKASHQLTPNPFESNVIKKYKCDAFLEFLKTSIKDYVSNLGYSYPLEYIIDASWLTKTCNGSFAIEHNHGATDISGVFYLQTNGNDGNLFFKDPNETLVSNLIMNCVVNRNIAPLEQGLLLMWPGYLSHGTYPNNTDDERLSLSFNIKFTRQGFTIKDNVEGTRGLVVRDDTWRDAICFGDL